jgi:hypothetical protein
LYLGIAIFVLLLARITLQIIGLIYFITYSTKIRTIDKVLLLVPEILPVKSIKNNLSDSDYQSLKNYLNVIRFYKGFFICVLVSSIISFF